MQRDYVESSVVFKALADETRLKILDILASRELCARKILENLHISQPTLSYHMRLLCDSKLVKKRKEGNWIYYWINKERVIEMEKYMGSLLEQEQKA